LALAVGLVVAGVATGATGESCEQQVTHSFRTADAVATWNESSQVSSTVDNTVVTVSESTGFVRVAVDNPNAYCTAVDVEVPAEIVRPADLGTVEAINQSDSITAEWRAMQNFTSGAEYTAISVTVPAGTSVEFAPNKGRVVALSWATETEAKAKGLVDRVTELWRGDDALDQRTYRIDGNAGNRRTIPLSSANTTAEVTDWIAEYRTADDEWVPVGQDPDAPVYYTRPSDDEIQLHYNDDVSVRWTANPTLTEKVSYRWNSYTAGWDGLGSIVEQLPF
jgi:hypothetical protein